MLLHPATANDRGFAPNCNSPFRVPDAADGPSYTGGVPVHVWKSLVIPDAELSERFTASGGPGGQHANKAATRVELRWDIVESDVVTEHQRKQLTDHFGPVARIVVDDERSQLRNRTIAEDRLAGRVRTVLTPVKKRRATKPTRGSQRRRVDSKRKNARQKQLRRKPGHDD